MVTPAANTSANKIIEVTYNKKNASHISITEKNRHNHAKSNKKIEIGNLLKDQAGPILT